MIDVALLGIIRRWYIRDHISIREISRRLDISRNTVRRYIRPGVIEPSYPSRQSSSALDEFAPRVSAWLSAEAVKSRKQRRTQKQMFLDLRELGYEGAYDRVAAFWRQWRVGQMERSNSARKSTYTTSRCSFARPQKIILVALHSPLIETCRRQSQPLLGSERAKPDPVPDTVPVLSFQRLQSPI
ncbi:winged helix-turn-helix transcriptional regulator [Herbaspirillum robiniae]|uniref:winged helix-turn-helix transcriptional regulator n=1 Tax=Herbaspirillum robiniae TaxID=2014887 RepID=UPI00101AE3B6